MNPGSDEAIAAGCTCPVMDNGHGRGYLGGETNGQGWTAFIVTRDCPLHGKKAEERKIMVPLREDFKREYPEMWGGGKEHE